jgi:hypothetical protein
MSTDLFGVRHAATKSPERTAFEFPLIAHLARKYPGFGSPILMDIGYRHCVACRQRQWDEVGGNSAFGLVPYEQGASIRTTRA